MKREKLYKQARLALKADNGKRAIDLLEKAARLAKASGNLEEAIDLLQEASTIAEDTEDLERRTALLDWLHFLPYKMAHVHIW